MALCPDCHPSKPAPSFKPRVPRNMSLQSRLQKLVQTLTAQSPGTPDTQALPRATVMLLLEVAWADHNVTADELLQVKAALRRLYDLTDGTADELIADAQAAHAAATSMYPFTRSLNDSLSPEERVQLITELWRLAYCDAQLDRYEDHEIRKIAELMYVSHADFIKAKLRARNSTPGSGQAQAAPTS